jgi:hypothetical protein
LNFMLTPAVPSIILHHFPALTVSLQSPFLAFHTGPCVPTGNPVNGLRPRSAVSLGYSARVVPFDTGSIRVPPVSLVCLNLAHHQ